MHLCIICASLISCPGWYVCACIYMNMFHTNTYMWTSQIAVAGSWSITVTRQPIMSSTWFPFYTPVLCLLWSEVLCKAVWGALRPLCPVEQWVWLEAGTLGLSAESRLATCLSWLVSPSLVPTQGLALQGYGSITTNDTPIFTQGLKVVVRLGSFTVPQLRIVYALLISVKWYLFWSSVLP